MENRPGIWRRLQEHSTPPPAELSREVLGAVLRDDGLFRGGLERLQDEMVMPAASLRRAILTKVYPGTAPTIRMGRIISYAAVIAAVAVCTWLAVRGKLSSHGNAPIVSTRGAGTILKGNDATANRAIAGDSVMPEKQGDSLYTKAATPEDTKTKSLFMSGHQSIALESKDYLASFVSYPYADVVDLFRHHDDRPMHIHVDQYADIVLNTSMKKTLHDLYSLKENGEPTRAARRTKDRLVKWRSSDSRAFDSWASNPLDPVDLGEFLSPSLFSFGRRTTLAGRLSHTSDSMSRVTGAAPAPAAKERDLTVSWQLSIGPQRTASGIADSYDGGVQTLFCSENSGRLRLVSLMRIESILLRSPGDSVIMRKESGKKLLCRFTAAQWAAYNAKYRDADVQFVADTIHVLEYTCKKAILSFRNGQKITAWYVPGLQSPTISSLLPMLNGLPGLPLRYEFTYRRKTVSYLATSVSYKPLSPDVLQ